MTVSLSDLTTPLTKDQVESSIYDVISVVGVNTTTWKPGSVVRTMIAAVSIVIAAFSTLIASIAAGGFLALATGSWLTLVARHVFGVERIEATFATGEITLTNTGGGVFSLGVGDLVVSNPTTGKTYRNTAAISLGAGATLTGVAIQAVESGAASSSTPDTITAFETPLASVTVTNPEAVVGLDAELDEALRVRCTEKLGSLSPNGPWDAYSYVARNTTRLDGTAIGITRTRIVKDGFGNVTTYLATATGGVTGAIGDTSTDLGVIDDAIQRQAAPLAVTATTASATAVPVAVTYEAWLYNTSGLSTSAQQDAIASALATFFSAQPIGGHVIGVANGKMFINAIEKAIANAIPEIFEVSVTLPAADVELAVSEVPTLGTITVTALNEEPPPDGL